MGWRERWVGGNDGAREIGRDGARVGGSEGGRQAERERRELGS